MADSPEKVKIFLEGLYEAAFPYAKKDFKDLGIYFGNDVLIDGDLGNIGDCQIEEGNQHHQKNRCYDHQMVGFQKRKKPFEKSDVI